MQDKLQKILNIKIEAIETNIDNLNYLNNELDKNNSDLDYINSKIALFNEGDILEFDSILIDDFNKIISMINPIVKETFDNKACNYQGIMYIIKGIRDGISLELTSLQEDAIKLFIKEMNAKSDELKETISNLLDSKEKLPETNLDVLEASLKDYEEIISKLTSNSYLTEIEEITDALDFANLPLLEKIDIFSNILRYNRDIYIKTSDKEEKTSSDNFDEIKITTDLKPNNDFFEEKDFDQQCKRLVSYSIKFLENEKYRDEWVKFLSKICIYIFPYILPFNIKINYKIDETQNKWLMSIDKLIILFVELKSKTEKFPYYAFKAMSNAISNLKYSVSQVFIVKWNIDTLLSACHDYIKATGRRISFEYAMISGVNDSDECARLLASKLKGMLCHVNLIPVNSVKERDFVKSSKERMDSFIRILEKSRINVTVRRTLGSDINASCGQLRRQAKKATV